MSRKKKQSAVAEPRENIGAALWYLKNSLKLKQLRIEYLQLGSKMGILSNQPEINGLESTLVYLQTAIRVLEAL